MTTFSPSDAALEGFRLTRERPRVLLAWSVFQFMVSVVMATLMIGLGGQHLMAIEQAGADGQTDPSAMVAELAELGPVYLAMLAVGLVLTSIMAAAVYRAVLTPQDDRQAYLRLGRDEFRLMVLKLAFVCIWGGIVFGVVLVAALVSTMASVFGSSVGGFAGLVTGLFAIGVLLFIAVRLSLAPVITFAEKRIAIFDSWNLTRGVFWRLLGAYLVALACIVVVALLGLVIFTAIAAIIVVSAGGQIADAGAAFSPNPTSFATYFTPTTLAYLAFAALLSALYYAVITAPGAVAYRALKGDATP